MNCPACGLELRIKKSYTASEGGRAVTVQQLFCLNPQCKRRSEKFPVKLLRHTHDESGEKAEVCECGAVLMLYEGGGYSLPRAGEYTLGADGWLTVICPDCGTPCRLDVGGRRMNPPEN